MPCLHRHEGDVFGLLGAELWGGPQAEDLARAWAKTEGATSGEGRRIILSFGPGSGFTALTKPPHMLERGSGAATQENDRMTPRHPGILAMESMESRSSPVSRCGLCSRKNMKARENDPVHRLFAHCLRRSWRCTGSHPACGCQTLSQLRAGPRPGVRESPRLAAEQQSTSKPMSVMGSEAKAWRKSAGRE